MKPMFRKYRRKRFNGLARLMKFTKNHHSELKYTNERFQIDSFSEPGSKDDAFAGIESEMIAEKDEPGENTTVNDTEEANNQLASDDGNINHEMQNNGMDLGYVSIPEKRIRIHS